MILFFLALLMLKCCYNARYQDILHFIPPNVSSIELDVKLNCRRRFSVIKIIWRKEDFQSLSNQLKEQHGINVVSVPSDVTQDHIGILIDDRDYDKIKPILETIIKEKQSMFFETKAGWIQLYIKDISHIESFGDDIYVHMKNKITHIIQTPLYQLEALLGHYGIMRISKSFMVNVMYIKYIRTTLYGKLDLELVDGTHLEVTRSFVKSFKLSLGLIKRKDAS